MLSRALPALCLVLLGCSDPSRFTLRGDGTTVDVTLEPFSFVVRGADGAAVLDSRTTSPEGWSGFAATLDRPRFEPQIVPGWDDYRAGDGPWTSGGKARVVSRSDTKLTVAWDLEGATMQLTLEAGARRVRVTGDVSGADGGRPRSFNKTTLAFALPEDEHFFGLGERFATFDHRGWSLYSWAEEGALGQGEDAPAGPENPYPNGPSMTYFPVPFFLSSRGYGLHVDSDFRSELHLGSERPDAWRVAVNHTRLALTVYVHPSPIEVLDAFTADTGRPLIPAPWVFGPRRRINPGNRVDGGSEWQVMRERGLPLTAIDDAMHFLPNLSHVGVEDELREWTSTLHAEGFKVMAYNNPYIADSPRAAADWSHGRDNGYLVTSADGGVATVFLISGTPLTVGMVDFTNPGAREWYRGLLRRTLALGYDGWMHDFGEYVPRGARFFDGRRGEEVHNPYPRLSAELAREVLQEALPDDTSSSCGRGGRARRPWCPRCGAATPRRPSTRRRASRPPSAAGSTWRWRACRTGAATARASSAWATRRATRRSSCAGCRSRPSRPS
jgi:alpha-glucosidase (family GH31 glycosyl hydrolase)